MWALSTCGEPDESKKNTHPKNITALFRESRYHPTGGGRRVQALVVAFEPDACPLEIRNKSGFELSFNGRDYFATDITAYTSSTVTVSTHGFIATDVVSLRYIMHDTPCINSTCAVCVDLLYYYSTRSNTRNTRGNMFSPRSGQNVF